MDRRTALQRLIAVSGDHDRGQPVVGTQLTYRAVAYMDTPQFCGATCHAMRPEYVGHQDSNHASVACAECHIAPGAGGWVEAKMNGTRQLWRRSPDSYPRPVPSALESGRLVPSRETCERCHWAEKIVATRLLVIPSYADDEQNSDSYTVLMMLVGGSTMQGIHHAHFAGGYRDPLRRVRREAADHPVGRATQRAHGRNEDLSRQGTTPEQAAGLPRHTMQCVDCHDRPTHAFWLPDRALNRALALGAVSATLPFIKKQGLAVLQATLREQRRRGAEDPGGDRGVLSADLPAGVRAAQSRRREGGAGHPRHLQPQRLSRI